MYFNSDLDSSSQATPQKSSVVETAAPHTPGTVERRHGAAGTEEADALPPGSSAFHDCVSAGDTTVADGPPRGSLPASAVAVNETEGAAPPRVELVHSFRPEIFDSSTSGSSSSNGEYPVNTTNPAETNPTKGSVQVGAAPQNNTAATLRQRFAISSSSSSRSVSEAAEGHFGAIIAPVPSDEGNTDLPIPDAVPPQLSAASAQESPKQQAAPPTETVPTGTAEASTSTNDQAVPDSQDLAAITHEATVASPHVDPEGGEQLEQPSAPGDPFRAHPSPPNQTEMEHSSTHNDSAATPSVDVTQVSGAAPQPLAPVAEAPTTTTEEAHHHPLSETSSQHSAEVYRQPQFDSAIDAPDASATEKPHSDEGTKEEGAENADDTCGVDESRSSEHPDAVPAEVHSPVTTVDAAPGNSDRSLPRQQSEEAKEAQCTPEESQLPKDTKGVDSSQAAVVPAAFSSVPAVPNNSTDQDNYHADAVKAGGGILSELYGADVSLHTPSHKARKGKPDESPASPSALESPMPRGSPSPPTKSSARLSTAARTGNSQARQSHSRSRRRAAEEEDVDKLNISSGRRRSKRGQREGSSEGDVWADSRNKALDLLRAELGGNESTPPRRASPSAKTVPANATGTAGCIEVNISPTRPSEAPLFRDPQAFTDGPRQQERHTSPFLQTPEAPAPQTQRIEKDGDESEESRATPRSRRATPSGAGPDISGISNIAPDNKEYPSILGDLYGGSSAGVVTPRGADDGKGARVETSPDAVPADTPAAPSSSSEQRNDGGQHTPRARSGTAQPQRPPSPPFSTPPAFSSSSSPHDVPSSAPRRSRSKSTSPIISPRLHSTETSAVNGPKATDEEAAAGMSTPTQQRPSVTLAAEMTRRQKEHNSSTRAGRGEDPDAALSAKQKRLRDEMAAKELAECTFHPVISPGTRAMVQAQQRAMVEKLRKREARQQQQQAQANAASKGAPQTAGDPRFSGLRRGSQSDSVSPRDPFLTGTAATADKSTDSGSGSGEPFLSSVYDRLYPAELADEQQRRRANEQWLEYTAEARKEMVNLRKQHGALVRHETRDDAFGVFLSNVLEHDCRGASLDHLLLEGLLVATTYKSPLALAMQDERESKRRLQQQRRQELANTAGSAYATPTQQQQQQGNNDTQEFRVALFDEFLLRQNAHYFNRARTVRQLEQQTAPTFKPQVSERSSLLAKRMLDRSAVEASTLSPEKAAEFRRERQLHLPTNSSMVRRRRPPPDYSHDPECTFRPKLSPAVAEGASKPNPKRFETLHLESTRLQQQRAREKERKEAEELAACTFKPKTNTDKNRNVTSMLSPENYDRYENYLQKKKERAEEKRRLDAQREAEAVEVCTFRPQISKPPAYISRMAESFGVLRNEDTEF